MRKRSAGTSRSRSYCGPLDARDCQTPTTRQCVSKSPEQVTTVILEPQFFDMISLGPYSDKYVTVPGREICINLQSVPTRSLSSLCVWSDLRVMVRVVVSNLFGSD